MHIVFSSSFNLIDMALSKNKIKYFNSLNLKKNRDNEQVFIAEGVKLVGDLLPYFRAKCIVATDEWLASNKVVECDEIIGVESLEEMKKITLLSTPSPVFVVFYRPQYQFHIDELLQKQEQEILSQTKNLDLNIYMLEIMEKKIILKRHF